VNIQHFILTAAIGLSIITASQAQTVNHTYQRISNTHRLQDSMDRKTELDANGGLLKSTVTSTKMTLRDNGEGADVVVRTSVGTMTAINDRDLGMENHLENSAGEAIYPPANFNVHRFPLGTREYTKACRVQPELKSGDDFVVYGDRKGETNPLTGKVNRR
jgi:hypothetical protein